MSDENAIDNPLNLDIPDHLQYSEEHVWVDDSVSPAIVGITAYAEQQLGELVFIDLPDEGTRVEAGDEVLELESAKAVEPLVCVRPNIRATGPSMPPKKMAPSSHGHSARVSSEDFQPRSRINRTDARPSPLPR